MIFSLPEENIRIKQKKLAYFKNIWYIYNHRKGVVGENRYIQRQFGQKRPAFVLNDETFIAMAVEVSFFMPILPKNFKKEFVYGFFLFSVSKCRR